MATENIPPLFALDIGTRSVVGLLLQEMNGGQFELLDSITIEHDERTMLDGQIHDIPSVAKVIREVKEHFEARHGLLNKVCVAAAGRSLKTRKAVVHVDITAKPLFDHNDVIHLELSAVQKAQFHLASEPEDETNIDYYCVGYSVLTYSLDNEPIGSLLDQIGKQASVEIIATFLPNVVVESLLAALSRANLELEALTLEPIAAIDVLIPSSMRRLNVALVDVGAGTSDIALTAENTVIAYGMVPIAGDEVTEAISDYFLLDFPDAEKVKKELTTQNTVQMTDILGIETTHQKDDVVSPIEETIHELARTICDEILSLNGRSPKAVMLVGGGSLTPHLPKYIAQYLGLAENRVAIRGAEDIKLLNNKDGQHFGPELVTPIGIAIAAKENPIEYVSVTVNGRTLRLFDVKKLTVGDGLLASGITIAKLYGKPGLAIMVTVQERLITVPGEYGKPPIITKNGQATSLDDPLEPGDELTVERGQHGHNALVTTSELLGDISTLSITMNNKKIKKDFPVLHNGEIADPQAFVQERDHISIVEFQTIQDVFISENISLTQFNPMHYYINGENWIHNKEDSYLLVNGESVGLDYILTNGDIIEWQVAHNPETLATILNSKKVETHMLMTVFYNDDPVTLKKELVEVKRGQEILELNSLIQQGEHLTISPKTPDPFILQDIFTLIDINIAEFAGKKISLKQNSAETNFTHVLEEGDRIELVSEDILMHHK